MSDKSFTMGGSAAGSLGGGIGGGLDGGMGGAAGGGMGYGSAPRPAPAGQPAPTFGGPPEPATGAGAAAPVMDVSTQSFMADVIDASRSVPVIVDFWAPWCGPCRTLGPVIERVVAEQKGRVRLAKMDIEQHPEIAGQMGIQSIPAVVAFVDGRPADAFMGAQPEAEVRRFVEKLASANPTPADMEAGAMLEAARALEANEDFAGAAQAYGQMAQMDPDDAEALAGLGRCYMAAGQPDTARAMLDQLPDEMKAKDPLAALAKALDLADEAAELGDTADLAAKVEANPNDHQTRYDYALALNGAGRREDAARELLSIVRADREWQEDGARAKLLELFEAWGPKERATLVGRRGLSSLLFS